jgi:hypothetical protein
MLKTSGTEVGEGLLKRRHAKRTEETFRKAFAVVSYVFVLALVEGRAGSGRGIAIA